MQGKIVTHKDLNSQKKYSLVVEFVSRYKYPTRFTHSCKKVR